MKRSKLVWRKWVKFKTTDYAQRGMMQGVMDMYTYSQTLAPLDDGQLTLNALVSSEGELTDMFQVILSYGNDPISKEYAVIQHENLNYNHKPPTQAKFLEEPFMALAPEIPRYIESTVSKKVLNKKIRPKKSKK